MSNLSASAEIALVTTNGAAAIVLYDPRLVPGRKVTVKNGPAQAGSTSITSAGVALPDGSPFVLTGINQSVQFESICSTPNTPSTAKWYVVGGAGSVVAGSVPWSSITGTPTTLAGYGISSVAWSAITGTPTTLAGYGITNGVANTRALTGSGAIKIAGDNAAHDLSADRTISVADAAAGVRGVIELDTDLGGTATAVNVVRLTGASNVVGIPPTTALTWDSSGPSIDDVSGDLGIHLAANKSFKIFDGATLALNWNYNSANAFVQFGGGGLVLQATGTQYVGLVAAAGGDARVLADTFNIYPTAGGTPNAKFDNTQLTLNRAFITFTAAVVSPSIGHLAPASGSPGIFGITGANGAGVTGSGADTNGETLILSGGGGKGVNGFGGGAKILAGANAAGTEVASVYAHMINGGAVVSLFGEAASTDLNARTNVLWMKPITNIGTNARPATGTQWYSLAGVPTILGSNSNSLELSFTATSTSTANGGTAVATALGGAGAVFMGVSFGGTAGKVLVYAP